MVCHPGRQHSHQLAMALAEAGMLAEYLTGVPACAASLPWWQRRVLRRQLEAYAIQIDPELVRHSFVAPAVRRIAARVARPATAIDWCIVAKGGSIGSRPGGSPRCGRTSSCATKTPHWKHFARQRNVASPKFWTRQAFTTRGRTAFTSMESRPSPMRESPPEKTMNCGWPMSCYRCLTLHAKVTSLPRCSMIM